MGAAAAAPPAQPLPLLRWAMEPHAVEGNDTGALYNPASGATQPEAGRSQIPEDTPPEGAGRVPRLPSIKVNGTNAVAATTGNGGSSISVGSTQQQEPPRRPEGISAHYLHEWVTNTGQEFQAARERLARWTPEQAFTDAVTGQVTATPEFTAGSGWSVGVQLPSGRKSFIGLTRDGKDLPGTNAYLPGYAPAPTDTPAPAGGRHRGRQLTEAERRTVLAQWLPRYSQSTRMAWDECVDPKMFEGSGWKLRAELTGCTNFIEVLRWQSP